MPVCLQNLRELCGRPFPRAVALLGEFQVQPHLLGRRVPMARKRLLERSRAAFRKCVALYAADRWGSLSRVIQTPATHGSRRCESHHAGVARGSRLGCGDSSCERLESTTWDPSAASLSARCGGEVEESFTNAWITRSISYLFSIIYSFLKKCLTPEGGG